MPLTHGPKEISELGIDVNASSSSISSDGEDRKVPKCPEGHTLRRTNIGYVPGTCNGCGRRMLHKELVMDCRDCNYYLCQDCCPQEQQPEQASQAPWRFLSLTCMKEKAEEEIQQLKEIRAGCRSPFAMCAGQSKLEAEEISVSAQEVRVDRRAELAAAAADEEAGHEEAAAAAHGVEIATAAEEHQENMARPEHEGEDGEASAQSPCTPALATQKVAASLQSAAESTPPKAETLARRRVGAAADGPEGDDDEKAPAMGHSAEQLFATTTEPQATH